MTLTTSDVDDAIRAAGLRVTESRRAVFDALRAHPHASADEIHAAVRPLVESTSLQSVYNALGDFAAAGLVRRIEPGGGAVEDVDCAVGHAPCLVPSDTHGYRVAVAEVTYWGLCAACATEDS